MRRTTSQLRSHLRLDHPSPLGTQFGPHMQSAQERQIAVYLASAVDTWISTKHADGADASSSYRREVTAHCKNDPNNASTGFMVTPGTITFQGEGDSGVGREELSRVRI